MATQLKFQMGGRAEPRHDKLLGFETITFDLPFFDSSVIEAVRAIFRTDFEILPSLNHPGRSKTLPYSRKTNRNPDA